MYLVIIGPILYLLCTTEIPTNADSITAMIAERNSIFNNK